MHLITFVSLQQYAKLFRLLKTAFLLSLGHYLCFRVKRVEVIIKWNINRFSVWNMIQFDVEVRSGFDLQSKLVSSLYFISHVARIPQISPKMWKYFAFFLLTWYVWSIFYLFFLPISILDSVESIHVELHQRVNQVSRLSTLIHVRTARSGNIIFFHHTLLYCLPFL